MVLYFVKKYYFYINNYKLKDYMHGTLDTSITDSIINNPKTGAAVTAISLAASNILPIINGDHIDPLFMDLLQAGAWLTTILVGILTTIGWVKKMFFSKPKNEPKS